MSECEFKIESAIEVFKKYFKVDPNLESPTKFESSSLDADPIEIKHSDITHFIGNQLQQYQKTSEIVIARKLHKYFIEVMMQKIKNKHKPTRQVLKGPSGVGKTTSLLIIGQIAKEMNILVFPINARSFTNDKQDIETTAYEFIEKWSDENKAFLDHLNSKLNKNVFDFKRSLTKQNAVDTLCQIIKQLLHQSIIPVLFIVDECNAFHHPHRIRQNDELKHITDPQMNPIGRFFCGDISYFAVKRGGVIFAYSSIFEFNSANFTDWITQVRPFSSQEWLRLFETEVSLE